MKKNNLSRSAFSNSRALVGLTLCLLGLALGLFAYFTFQKDRLPQGQRFADNDREEHNRGNDRGGRDKGLLRDIPTADEDQKDEAASLGKLEQYWNDRVTYPTGRFNPKWLRDAAVQHAKMQRGLPAGSYARYTAVTPASATSTGVAGATQSAGKIGVITSTGGKGIMPGPFRPPVVPQALSTTSFTALGPAPERMTGCSGCYDYGTTEGRINDIVFDPTTTTSGSIVAYSASVGGGVWKTTNCCSSSTTWNVVTDDPLIATTSIDTLAVDPNNHNTIYAGTGDLNFGSFSMGSQGILKSTDAGNSWTVLAANVFGMEYTEPSGNYPQYNAVGKVRVDPNNSNNVMAGTKQGVYLSNDAGVTWTQCPMNTFTTQRQDITGLELTNIAGSTRILAAIGTRGFATPVQYDLGNQGANGIYMATMPASGCPTFTSIARNDNGFVFGAPVTGSPYTILAPMNAGTGVPYSSTTVGNQLSRIDIAVAPSSPNTIYAQAGSIASNTGSGCGNTSGCQLGAWWSTDGGTTWTFMTGSAGGSLTNCGAASGDYPQNWYDQGIAVDPNNPDRIYFNTFETWLATRTGTSWYDLTCGYNGNSVANHVVHVDHHAQAYFPGSSDIFLVGDDGGIHGTTNASAAISGVTRPTWFNMDTGINSIEFYSGDISGNFATDSAPSAVGGAQDNGPSSVTFSGTPTGPVQWQMGLGGDGFSGQIDPVGTGVSLRFWEGNNSGGLARCIAACTTAGATWTSKRGAWTGDTQSFVLPINLFHGGIPSGDDCPAAGASGGGCGHLIAGTTRVWETITGNAASTVSWYVTNNPITSNLTKQALGNRSYINQVKYSPKFQSVAIVGTNDGNVQIGFNLGTGTQAQANWVNVTNGNAVLPNRPVLGIALDPSVATANVPVGYAAIGGFNDNTPIPGHVFQVTCASNCGSFVWADKTGNLPDIPADSVIVNPNYPQQVFVGTDWGLYYTDDVTQATPVWKRFDSGLPHAMVWDMSIDRGSTTLSVWTRSRGAYAFPLPVTAITAPTVSLVSAVSRMTHGGSVTFDLPLALTGSPTIEPRTDGAGDYTIVLTFNQPVNTGSATSNSGTVSSTTYSGNSMIVNLSGVANQQYLTVAAKNVSGPGTQTLSAASVRVGILAGDANQNGVVDSGDVFVVRQAVGQNLDGSDYLDDVNISGVIDSGDVFTVRQQTGTALPNP